MRTRRVHTYLPEPYYIVYIIALRVPVTEQLRSRATATHTNAPAAGTGNRAILPSYAQWNNGQKRHRAKPVARINTSSPVPQTATRSGRNSVRARDPTAEKDHDEGDRSSRENRTGRPGSCGVSGSVMSTVRAIVFRSTGGARVFVKKFRVDFPSPWARVTPVRDRRIAAVRRRLGRCRDAAARWSAAPAREDRRPGAARASRRRPQPPPPRRRRTTRRLRRAVGRRATTKKTTPKVIRAISGETNGDGLGFRKIEKFPMGQSFEQHFGPIFLLFTIVALSSVVNVIKFFLSEIIIVM